MKTHCVRADSSQALTSDFKSPVFLTDSFESPGFHIRHILCIPSVRSSGIFSGFSKDQVPFINPYKVKKGNFTGKYCTVLRFESGDCFCYEKTAGLNRAECSRGSSVSPCVPYQSYNSEVYIFSGSPYSSPNVSTVTDFIF